MKTGIIDIKKIKKKYFYLQGPLKQLANDNLIYYYCYAFQ